MKLSEKLQALKPTISDFKIKYSAGSDDVPDLVAHSIARRLIVHEGPGSSPSRSILDVLRLYACPSSEQFISGQYVVGVPEVLSTGFFRHY